MDSFITASAVFFVAMLALVSFAILGDRVGTERERMYWCEKTETLKVEFDKCMEDR